jgi:hypothetical protein
MDVSEEHTASIFRVEVRRQYVPPKRWYSPTSLHSNKIRKTTIDIFFTVRTSSHGSYASELR